MAGGRDVRLEALRIEYARWLLVDRVTKEANGLPTTHTEWAGAKEVATRTLRRWRTEDDEFAELLEREQATAAQRLPGGSVQRAPSLGRPADEQEAVEQARAGGVSDVAQLEYLSIKAALIEKAKDGDREALSQYMKFWGTEFAAEEREQRTAGFAHLSDNELVAEIEGLLGVLSGG